MSTIYITVFLCWYNLHMSFVQGPNIPETMPSNASAINAPAELPISSNYLKNTTEKILNLLMSSDQKMKRDTKLNPNNTSTTASSSVNAFPNRSTNTTKVYTITTTTLSPEEVYKRKIAAQRQIIERDWCEFLKSLYKLLRHYRYQQEPRLYNVADLKDWEYGKEATQGLKIDKSNVETFFKLIDIREYAGFAELSNWNISLLTPKMFQDLNNVIELTIGMKHQVFCDGNKLVITRPILTLMNVIADITNTTCDEEIRIIELFASDIIYVNRDIDLSGKNLILAIMAPQWLILGEVRIDLSGFSPEKMDPPKAQTGLTGRRGQKGQPGAPGGHSGSFIGLGKIFENIQPLTINTNGGTGQSGQDGGDGGAGADGKDADIEKGNFECEKGFIGITHKCFGQKGLPGGPGAQGGAGGQGGKAGNMGIISMYNENSSPIIKGQDGKDGEDGTPGKGGDGGKNGCDKWDIQFIAKLYTKKNCDTGYGPSGEDGKGLNTENQRTIKEPQMKLEDYTGEIINDYKNYLEDNLVNNYTRARDFEWLLQLFRNDNITLNYYKLADLIQQFLLLEKHFYHLYDKMNLLPLYAEIQQQIDKTAKAKQNDSNYEEILKVLIQLTTSTQSKICMFHEAASGKFIANVESFLNMFMQNVQLLKDYHEEETIYNKVNQYKAEIDKQISESLDLIEHNLIPTIRDYENTILKSIDELLAQIPEMQRKLEEKRSEIKKAIEDLKQAFILSIISGVLDVAAEAVQYIPVVGQFISAGLSTYSTAFGVLGASYENDASQVDLGVSTGIADRSREILQTLETLTIPLEESYKAKTENTKGEVTDSLVKGSEGVKRLCVNSSFCKELLDPKTLNEMKEKLKKGGGRAFKSVLQNYKGLMGGMKRAKTVAAPIANKVANGVTKVLDTQNKLQAAQSAWKLVDSEIKELENFKMNIKNTLMPVVQNFMTVINNLVQELTNKSASALEVRRNQLTTEITKTKEVLLSFMGNFSMAGTVKNAMDGILNAVDTMINIFKKIEYYKDMKKTGDLSAELHSAKFMGLQIKDKELALAIVKLKASLQSSLILLDYQQSMNQLKQFVFPLGKYYFEKISAPSFLEKALVSYSRENFLYIAINEVQTYKKNIIRSNVFVSKYDKLKYRMMFYSGLNFGKPFYVWRNRMFSESISSLMAGKEIALTANLEDHFENAIKFNYIHIRFKVLLYQNKLDKILDKFMAVMTHMGNSYYRCANKTYVIITESQQFRFTFEKYNNKVVKSNMVFGRISTGDFLLSPFATWKFQLLPANNESDFKLLSEFRRYADLELVGAGEYYENDPEVCPEDLSDLYDLTDMRQHEDLNCLNNCNNCSYTDE